MIKTPSKPDLLYRLSKDGSLIYLRVPDSDTEQDVVLMFNRVMADLGFPDPKEIFNERLGVAVAPRKKSYRQEGRIINLDLFEILRQIFNMMPISNRDWYETRF